jgi:hypothetical protein
LEKYQMPRWGKQKKLITKQTWNVTIQFLKKLLLNYDTIFFS